MEPTAPDQPNKTKPWKRNHILSTVAIAVGFFGILATLGVFSCPKRPSFTFDIQYEKKPQGIYTSYFTIRNEGLGTAVDLEGKFIIITGSTYDKLETLTFSETDLPDSTTVVVFRKENLDPGKKIYFAAESDQQKYKRIMNRKGIKPGARTCKNLLSIIDFKTGTKNYPCFPSPYLE